MSIAMAAGKPLSARQSLYLRRHEARARRFNARVNVSWDRQKSLGAILCRAAHKFHDLHPRWCIGMLVWGALDRFDDKAPWRDPRDKYEPYSAYERVCECSACDYCGLVTFAALDNEEARDGEAQ